MAQRWSCWDTAFCTLVGLLVIFFNYSDSQFGNSLKTENGRLLASDEANALPVPDVDIGVAINSNLRSIERKRRNCSANIVRIRNFPRTDRHPHPDCEDSGYNSSSNSGTSSRSTGNSMLLCPHTHPEPLSLYIPTRLPSAHDGHDEELNQQHHRFCKYSSLNPRGHLIVAFPEPTPQSPFLFSNCGSSAGRLGPGCHRSELQGLEKRE